MGKIAKKLRMSFAHITFCYYMARSSETVEDAREIQTNWREIVIKLKNSTPSLNRILMPLLYLRLILLLFLFAFHNIFPSSMLSRCLIHWPEFGKWTTVFSYGFFNRTIRDWLYKRVSVVSLQQCPFKFLTIYFLHYAQYSVHSAIRSVLIIETNA